MMFTKARAAITALLILTSCAGVADAGGGPGSVASGIDQAFGGHVDGSAATTGQFLRKNADGSLTFSNLPGGGFADQIANKVFAGPSSGGAAAPDFRALVAGDIPNLNTSILTAGQLALARGGTGIDASGTTNGQLLIGRTSDHTLQLASLTAGSGISITPGASSITIATTGGSTPTFQQVYDASSAAAAMIQVGTAKGIFWQASQATLTNAGSPDAVLALLRDGPSSASTIYEVLDVETNANNHADGIRVVVGGGASTNGAGIKLLNHGDGAGIDLSTTDNGDTDLLGVGIKLKATNSAGLLFADGGGTMGGAAGRYHVSFPSDKAGTIGTRGQSIEFYSNTTKTLSLSSTGNLLVDGGNTPAQNATAGFLVLTKCATGAPSGAAPEGTLTEGGDNHLWARLNSAWVQVDGGGGGSAPFADNAAIIKNNSDPTKLLVLDASLITTGTTRTIKAPDIDGNVFVSVAKGRQTGLTAPFGSVATITVGPADTSYEISVQCRVNSISADATLSLDLKYTDESAGSTTNNQALKLPLVDRFTAVVSVVDNAHGAGMYLGAHVRVRAKAGSHIYIDANGTGGDSGAINYNVEAEIIQRP